MLLPRPFHTHWIEAQEHPGERGGSGSEAGAHETDEPAEGEEHLVVLLDDILARVPTRCLLPGLHDPDLELRFHVDELCSSIARGKVEVRVSRLAEICPEVFQMPLSPLEDAAIRLPLQKLIEQLGFVETPRAKTPDSARRHSSEKGASHVWVSRRSQQAVEPAPTPNTAPQPPAAAQPIVVEPMHLETPAEPASVVEHHPAASQILAAAPDTAAPEIGHGPLPAIENPASQEAELAGQEKPAELPNAAAVPAGESALDPADSREAEHTSVQTIIDLEKFVAAAGRSSSISSLEAHLHPEEQESSTTSPAALAATNVAPAFPREATPSSETPVVEAAVIEAVAAEPTPAAVTSANDAEDERSPTTEITAGAAMLPNDTAGGTESAAIPPEVPAEASAQPSPVEAASEPLAPIGILAPAVSEIPTANEATHVATAAGGLEKASPEILEATSVANADPAIVAGEPKSPAPVNAPKAPAPASETESPFAEAPVAIAASESAVPDSVTPPFAVLKLPQLTPPIPPPAPDPAADSGANPPELSDEPLKNGADPSGLSPAARAAFVPIRTLPRADAAAPSPATPTATHREYRAPLEPVQMPVVRLPAPRPPVFVRAGDPPRPTTVSATVFSAPSKTESASIPDASATETKPAPAVQPALIGRPILHPPRVFRKETRERLDAAAAEFTPAPSAIEPDDEVDIAIPPLALPRFDQDALQAVFLTHEALDLPKIARLSNDLPGISGCLILLGEEVAESGEWPGHLGIAALRSICKRLTAFASALGTVSATRAVTMHMDDRCLTFFPRPGFCFGVAHSPRGFSPGVREKLSAVADGLASGS